jgi:hypothetical protein
VLASFVGNGATAHGHPGGKSFCQLVMPENGHDAGEKEGQPGYYKSFSHIVIG